MREKLFTVEWTLSLCHPGGAGERLPVSGVRHSARKTLSTRKTLSRTDREGQGCTLCEPLDLTPLNPLLNLSLVKITFYHL